jgi:O-antigen ligase
MHNPCKNLLSAILIASIIVMSMVSVFTVSETFSDAMIVSKWYMMELMGIVCGVLILTTLILAKPISASSHTSAWIELSVLAVCTVQASLMLIQTTGLIDKYGDFTCGSFDNTAGFVTCVCISWPCGWRLMGRNMNVTTCTVAICKTICLLSIFISGSRAGLICILFISLCFIFPKRRRYRLLLFTLLIAVTLICLLFLKRDSSRGRWFICERTAELIAEKPLTGWGEHGFEKQYMPRQAAYLKAHPNSEYAMLADGIKHPLNEYLNLTVNFGLLGLGVLAGLMLVTSRYYLRHRSAESKVCLYVLLSVAVL